MGPDPPVIDADAGYGDCATFRRHLTDRHLTDRHLTYVVAVMGSTLARPAEAVPAAAPYSGRGRHPTRRYPTPVTCKDLVLAAGEQALTELTWRRGTKAGPANPTAAIRSRLVALRVRPANRTIPRDENGVLP